MATNLPPSERINWRALAGVCIAKNESDIIGVNLRHLYRYGLRQFVFADNGSTDNTVALVEEFRRDHPDATVIIVSDHTAFLHPERRNALMTFAARFFSVQWIFPFDADDFLWLSPGPPIELEEMDARITVIELPWLQLHPARHADVAASLRLPRLIEVNQTLSGSKTKILVRWHEDSSVEEGAHQVFSRSNRFIRYISGWDMGIASAHYPVRSASQLARKVLSGAHAIPHWGAAADIVRGAASDDALYKAFMARDDAWLTAFCKELNISPKKLAYIYDMVANAPIAFPIMDRVKGSSDAPRHIERRSKYDRTRFGRIIYNLETGISRSMNRFSRWRAGV